MMKLVDYKNRNIKKGQRVKIIKDVPSIDGMLRQNSIVTIDDFSTDSQKIRVTDSLGKIYWIEPSQVSASFL
jgi:hypothetical protein